MWALLDRMLRPGPRDLVLTFHRAESGPFGAGFLTTPQALTATDIDRIRSSCEGREFVDGETVRIAR